MSIFKLRTPVEICLQKLDIIWRTICQVANRPPSDRGPSVASGFGLSVGRTRLSALSRARTVQDLTRIVHEWLFS
jgi:hypothetical protein